MGANIPSWTQNATGTAMNSQQFLANPSAQDAVFNKYFGSYMSKYGNSNDAASMWFSGKPLSQGANSTDVLGTTGSAYVDKFNTAIGQATTGLEGFTSSAKQGGNGTSGSLSSGTQSGSPLNLGQFTNGAGKTGSANQQLSGISSVFSQLTSGLGSIVDKFVPGFSSILSTLLGGMSSGSGGRRRWHLQPI